MIRLHSFGLLASATSERVSPPAVALTVLGDLVFLKKT